jgi:hypothetical protein
MQNRLIAICLLVALISSNFSRFFVFAGFEANQKFIASSLCENKSRPWMHCNGKCYLMKKLKQAEEKEKKQEREDQKSRYQEALPGSVVTVNIIKSTFKVEYLPSITPGIVNRSSSIFQPPQV